jgi:hypothetical protein
MSHRDLKPRMEFTLRCEASRVVRSLQNQDSLSLSGQVSGTDQAIVSRPDYDGIVVLQVEFLFVPDIKRYFTVKSLVK